LRAQDGTIIQDAVLRDMRERDERDTKRAVAPLKPADDAFVLDTTELDADQAFAAALDFIASGRRDG
jgi:cytidylate kinase